MKNEIKTFISTFEMKVSWLKHFFNKYYTVSQKNGIRDCQFMNAYKPTMEHSKFENEHIF